MFFAQSSHHESSNNASRRSQGFHQSSPTGTPPPPPPPPQQQQQQQSRNHAEYRCRPHVVVALAAGLSASLSTSRSLSSSSASCAVATDSAVHSITRCLPVAAAAAAAVPAMPFTTALLDADADEGNRQATSISVSLPPVDHHAVPAAPVVPPFAYRDLPRQAQATAPVARPATSPNTAASSSLSGVLVAATRDVSNRETTLARSTSPRGHPPLTHDNDNDDEDDDDDEKQRRSSTDGATVRTPAVVTATPTTAFPAPAISPGPQPSSSSSPSNPADDKVGSFVREAMNEVDVPPGLLRFLQERKQQESPSTTSSSPATTTMPVIPVAVSTAPMHSHPLIFARRPSTKEAPAGPRGAVAGGPALTSLVAGQQQQQLQQPKQQQQEQQLQLQLFSLADATSTAVRRSNETSTTNACTDTPAAVTAAQSEVRGPLELVMLDQPVSRPSLDLNSASGVTVGTIAGEGVESSKTTSRTQWTRMLRKGRANSGQTSSHGEETATTTMHSLCTASRTAHPARLSAAQPGDNVQASSEEGSSHHPSTPSPSPNPFCAVARCRGSGADLERKEVSPCLQHLRQGLLQPASGGGAQSSITSFPSPVGRAMTPLAAAAPTTNFAVSLASSPPFSMPLPTTTAVGSAHKRRSLLVVRNMEDAPFLIQQHHQQMEQQQEEEQRQQQQHSPQHSWQLAHRRSPPTFTSSCTAGASLLSDSPVGMNFVDGSAMTSPTPAGDLEPPLTAGVAWMDSFSPYASIVSPTATQTTMATNYGSTVFTGSLTQSIGVLSAAALTLAERSATRPVQPGFGSPSQSATSRQRRPQATAVTPLTTGLMMLPSNVGHIGPSSAALHSPASSDKYSGRQNSHEHRSLLYQQQQQQQQHQHPS